MEELLKKSGVRCVVYDKTCANPTVHNVEEARELYVSEKCEGIIAFGGGSSMDCAKAVGARIAYPKKSMGQLKGLLKVLRKIPTLIAIPTTAGTGSEVTLTAVITDSEKKHKYTMNDFTLIPSYAVLDPQVTMTLPPSLTATTGMDALTHAVAHSLGGQYNIPHGLANAVLMPIVLEAYGKPAYKKLHELGVAAGVASKEDTHQEGAEKFIKAIRELNERMNIPTTLPGIKKEDIPTMAKHAAKEANPLYPVPVLMNAKELETFYEKVADWSKA